ncbi:MAG: DNA-processing protein DprA, partial [Lentisphaeria bacterium]|nr:DNA-processing protein DprA [Lentisphaeria bacterium]
PTIGVIGAGLNHFYPQDNLELACRMIDCGGAVVSEFPLNFPIHRTNFPRRNRIVAALGRAVIVTEAGLQSGALITARQAAELGREVFAVPGHADNAQAQGCHRLIKEGAGLIENFQDVAEALGFGHATEPELPGFGVDELPASAPPAETAVMNVLRVAGEADLEQLRDATGLDTGTLLSVLMTLELKFHIVRGDDQRYRPARGR